MKEKIIILTDSVALPRKYDTRLVIWEETYIYRLKQLLKDYEIINLSIGGGSIKDIRDQINYYKVLNPICVILHCGIVDAAPRAFGRIEMDIIKKMRLFRLTKPFVPLLRKYRAHHYANLNEFKSHLMYIKNEINAPNFLAIGIVPSCELYERQLPNVTNSIDNYNKILSVNSHFISLEDISRRCVLEDHHHINEFGQDFIFKRLVQQLSKCGIK